MYERVIVTQLAEGLHARPASNFVKTANNYKDTKIELIKGDKSVNAKSMMSVLSLGVVCGSEVRIRGEGDNEKEAVDALCDLLEGKS